MIESGEGNLLKADVEALVNTVNCNGYMGRGIALQFKKAFPDNNRAYEQVCKDGKLIPGRMLVFETGAFINPKFIINFPTKRNWRNKSRIEDIESGLTALVQEVRERQIRSIAIPPLGCGLGGLRWADVRPSIEKAFHSLPSVRVVLFEPKGSPTAADMPVRTKRPRLTLARSLFLHLMSNYRELGYRLTLLEIQKLAYFLQCAGQPLRLRYDKGPYGPYAPNLDKVLQALESHFTRGYGDSSKPDQEIAVLEGAIDAAATFLNEDHEFADAKPRLERVEALIDGFQTPYGMELLASVHWVACQGESPAKSSEQAVVQVHGWNDRKRNLFQTKHIHIAWQRLASEGWLDSNDHTTA